MKALSEAKPRRAKRRGPDEIPVLAYLASTHLKYGSLDKARALYSLLVSLRPRKQAYRAALGYACFKSGRAEEALAHLETAFKGRRLTGWEAMLLSRTLRANGMQEESRAVMGRLLGPLPLGANQGNAQVTQAAVIRKETT